MRVIALFLLFMITGCAGAFPAKPEDSTFQKIIEMPGIPKDAIHEKSMQWVATTFKSGKNVVEYENKQEGIIIGNGAIPRPVSDVNPFGNGMIAFAMKEEIKDGKARITFDRMMAVVPPNQYGTGGEYPILDADLRGTRATLSAMVEDLKKSILTNKKPDW